MTTTDQDREDFEAACREKYPHLTFNRSPGAGDRYYDVRTDFAWLGWKLAQERARSAPAPQVPAAYGRVIDGKAVTLSLVQTPANNEPLYAASAPLVPDGREAWECERCGRLSYRPEGDLRTMQAAGYVGCCPERKLRAVRVVHPATPVASHEPASVSNNAGCVSSAGDNAKAAWNRIADEFNQWDALGADERQMAEDMFAAGRNSSPPPETAKAEVVADDKVRSYVDSYAFRGDAGDHTPTEAERVMLEDFAHGLLCEIATPPTAPAAARSAAEEMRERCAEIVEKAFSHNWVSLAGAIRALPLPGEEA